jgi:hypothetical protein
MAKQLRLDYALKTELCTLQTLYNDSGEHTGLHPCEREDIIM